jgi:hypothetical protein
MPGVRVEQRILPGDRPPGDFDLIVFSEFPPAFVQRRLGQEPGMIGPTSNPSTAADAVPAAHCAYAFRGLSTGGAAIAGRRTSAIGLDVGLDRASKERK